jgi:hypothetical protein
MFEVENRGNGDIELLFAEVWVPQCLIHPTWVTGNNHRPAVMEIDEDIPGYRHVQHYSRPGVPEKRRLEPVITRSMGIRRIRDLRFSLKGQYSEDEVNQIIRYQIHAANYDTVPEEVRFKDIEIKP